jgi:hypothetical protein
MAAAGRILTRTATLLREGKLRAASSSESTGAELTPENSGEGPALGSTGDRPEPGTSRGRGSRIKKS